MKKLEKSISNKLKLGKYSLFEIITPLIALLSTVLIKWELYVGDFEWVVRGLIVYGAYIFWTQINKLKVRKVRSYKAHWLLKVGLVKLNKFSSKKQFIG